MEEAKKKTGEEYINAMYDSKLAAQNAQLKKNYDSAMSDIAKEQEDLNRNADEASRQASVQSAQERQRWAESAAASGLSSGADAQARLVQGNQLQKSLTDISTARDTGEAELNRQRSRLADQYAAQIEEARANNDYARAEALYQEALREEQKYKEKASLMAGAGDFSEYGSYYGLTQQQMATLSAEYQKADKQAVANIMAEAGEFGPLQELYGLSDEYRAALEKNTAARTWRQRRPSWPRLETSPCTSSCIRISQMSKLKNSKAIGTASNLLATRGIPDTMGLRIVGVGLKRDSGFWAGRGHIRLMKSQNWMKSTTEMECTTWDVTKTGP